MVNLNGWAISHPSRFWKRVDEYADEIDHQILNRKPSDDNFGVLLLYYQSADLEQLLNEIEKMQTEDFDPTTLPKATEIIPTRRVTPFKGKVIPNFHVLVVKDWSAYYRIDISNKSCKGVELIFEAHRIENLRDALERLWDDLSDDIWGN